MKETTDYADCADKKKDRTGKNLGMMLLKRSVFCLSSFLVLSSHIVMVCSGLFPIGAARNFLS
jgi:hypothetical protein